MTSQTVLLLTMAGLMPLQAMAASSDLLKPYPAAMQGFERHVIELPQQPDEESLKVELIAGKTQTVDCNQQRLAGQWQQKTVQGWGYDYYVLDRVGPGMSTLMACPDDTRRQAFVPVAGEVPLLRYNSKLPVVIYAPTGVEVRYRLWSAGASQPASVR